MPDLLPDRHSLPELVQHYLPASRRERLTPFVYAGGMVAIGLTLLLAKPRIGNVPRSDLSGDRPAMGRRRRAARKSRDVVGPFAPDPHPFAHRHSAGRALGRRPAFSHPRPAARGAVSEIAPHRRG